MFFYWNYSNVQGDKPIENRNVSILWILECILWFYNTDNYISSVRLNKINKKCQAASNVSLEELIISIIPSNHFFFI